MTNNGLGRIQRMVTKGDEMIRIAARAHLSLSELNHLLTYGLESFNAMLELESAKRKKEIEPVKKPRPPRPKLPPKPGDVLREKLARFSDRGQPRITVEQVLGKIGAVPRCYLTGKRINLEDAKTYSLDHRTPRARGGSSTLDNLELSCREANQAKSDLPLCEFIALCRTIADRDKSATW